MAQHLNHPLMTDMLEDRQYKRLLQEHEKLEAEIAAEQASPSADSLGVKRLKVEKLHVAERLEDLRKRLS